ncbi:M15 family metallopeptidase [Streptomyces decoyicus]
MGCPEAATPEESEGACYTEADGLPERAQRNRAVMGEALSAVDMVNYPTEWWHWSYGDRYWALCTFDSSGVLSSSEMLRVRGGEQRGASTPCPAGDMNL